MLGRHSATPPALVGPNEASGAGGGPHRPGPPTPLFGPVEPCPHPLRARGGRLRAPPRPGSPHRPCPGAMAERGGGRSGNFIACKCVDRGGGWQARCCLSLYPHMWGAPKSSESMQMCGRFFVSCHLMTPGYLLYPSLDLSGVPDISPPFYSPMR